MSVTGDRIKACRIERGLSVQELAEKIGKNRSTIYKYEDERIEKLPYAVVGDIAKVLNVSPAYLMGWSDEPHIDEKTATNERDGLSPTDELLVMMFNNLSDEGKAKVIRLMREITDKNK